MTERKIRWMIALMVAACVFATYRIASAAAVDCFLVIKGSKQGDFKGEGTMAQSGKIPAAQFSFGVKTASEAGSGKATGREAAPPPTSPREQSSPSVSERRQHGMVNITKEWGASSPMLAKALATGEVLTSVDIEFVRAGANGSPAVYKTLHLKDAIITAIQPMPASGGTKMEVISFSFGTDNAAMKTSDGKTMAMDDWAK